ncbi:MAG: nickel pincer cofactor biosynthesis protein LarB [Deltaproteobacteria bacterium]|nr:nickel pincer cofactor biosynthesis protein LarB [Deltaproteobacteria bacterium]
MDATILRNLLEGVKKGDLTLDDAVTRLKKLPFEDLGFARVDHHRTLRHGSPEVIFGEGKTKDQIVAILKKLNEGSRPVLATRVAAETGKSLLQEFPHGKYFPHPRLFVLEKERPAVKTKGNILVICAGTSDLPVADEAYLTAHYMGNEVQKIYDAGVAGIHRLLSDVESIQKASVIIAVAGMEGALIPVVAGLAGVPVIGVPTSVGYGASLSGLTPLFAMLSSCASGVTVVNIDNGFGAGYAASLMNRV